MKNDTASRLSAMLAGHAPLSLWERVAMVLSLSWPAIMAQLSSILMEYIDASMVGSLGASASASIGLVSTTTWLIWGLGGALCTGYSVQVAHMIGARNHESARDVLVQSLMAVAALGVLVAVVGIGISGHLPHWLGGNDDINPGATKYFMVLSAVLPISYMRYLASSMLRCSGNMLVPGLVNVLMCVLDIVINFFLIFEPRDIMGIHVPGAGLGVAGAALGTGSAELIAGGFMLWFTLRKSPQLNLRGYNRKIKLNMETLRKALGISMPIASERILMCGAQIITTVIVAPLGTAAIAANAFGITAESLCYMPGYGISDAATTLSGQSLGAGRRDMARGFGNITIALGTVIMSIMGLVMWLCAPLMMSILTPVEEVRMLGVGALRIEAWAEPMFAASIVTYGVMVGAGYTTVPACINLGSIWAVRLTLAALLAPVMGLNGVWLAMCIELCVRGVVFLAAYFRTDWMKHANIMPEPEIREYDENPQPYEQV